MIANSKEAVASGAKSSFCELEFIHHARPVIIDINNHIDASGRTTVEIGDVVISTFGIYAKNVQNLDTKYVSKKKKNSAYHMFNNMFIPQEMGPNQTTICTIWSSSH